MTSMTNPTPMTNNTPAINARQPKLLLVDDQPINLQTLYQTFSADHQLYMATNGEQSLNLAALHQPDLILLDLVMPEMDGYEVFRHLKENPATAHIPVIFITAHTGEASEVHGLDVGAVDFISKPINPQIVRARVKTHLTLQAQKLALQESEQHTQAILDNAIDGIITSNGQGVIESANRAVETIFGYTPAELLGQDIGLLIPEPYCSQYKAAFAGQVAVPSGDNSNKKEIEGRHKEGHVFPMEISMSNNLYHDRKMIVALMRDISERRRIEQMKTDFISTVSHELRTPLTSISGALGLVVGGAIGAVPPAVKSMIDMAHKNSLRLSHLINDLLDMEKMLAGKLNFEFKVQELMPLIDSAVESTRAYGERLKVDFCISQRTEGVRVNVDGDRLHQVLANFLSNAAKFSTSGEQVQITVNCDQDSVRVAVIDHGAGVPEQFKSRIFQKFAQADSSNTRTKGGTGLGLAIAQEMILRMNGTIDFSSEEGKGSCFYFDLPMVADT